MFTMQVAAFLIAFAAGLPAMAQQSASPPGQAPAPGPAHPAPGATGTGQGASGGQQGGHIDFMTARQQGSMDASKLIGQDVHGANDQDIGPISEVLVDPNGQIVGVVIAVGDYLGTGDTRVAVPMQALHFEGQDQPTTTGAVGGPSPGSSATSGGEGVPAHILLIITKDQLQDAPKFQDDHAASGAPSTNAPRQ